MSQAASGGLRPGWPEGPCHEGLVGSGEGLGFHSAYERKTLQCSVGCGGEDVV